MENGGLHQLYCEEVLGLKMFPPSAETALPPVAVECEELTPPARALLQKVMGSIGIQTWTSEGAAHHVFRFSGAGAREESGGSVIWNLPTLSEMLGDSPEVAARKKSAWSLLQLAKRELSQ